jgi:hypothetical protein
LSTPFFIKIKYAEYSVNLAGRNYQNILTIIFMQKNEGAYLYAPLDKD